MRAERAAAYLDISPTSFFRLVEDGVLPKPTKIRGMATWDRLDLDAAYDDLKDGGTDNTMSKLLRGEKVG